LPRPSDLDTPRMTAWPARSEPPVASPRAGAIRTILVATDFGQASDAALERAITLATALHASLLILSVIDDGALRLPGGGFVARVDQVRAERERLAANAMVRARAAGVQARSLVWQGDVGESILEAVVAEGAELLVVGTHARGAIGRLLLGSVSDHVVRHATVPVLVVRPTPD
jgi:nucleotide-binding universal stress UspA family protein